MDTIQLINLLAQVSGVPGLGTAVSIVGQIWNTCNAVHDKQRECRELADTCVQVILNMSENVRGLDGTYLQQAVDEVITVLNSILARTRKWADKGFFVKFVWNGTFAQEIASFKSQLNFAMSMFTNSGIIDIARTQQLQTELLRQIVAKQDNQHQLLLQIQHQRIPREESRELMESVQRTLWDTSDDCVKQDLGPGLYQICRATGSLPPFADLSGQIRRLDPNPIDGGTSSDIWRGMWLENRMVAVKCLRAHRATDARTRRFEEEAILWRRLKHLNVLDFFGIAIDQGPAIALISPWMRNRDAVKYVQSNPRCDRRKILRGTARGLKYLHSQNIVHGDLRGSKILVDDSGNAKICDFGLAGVGADSSSQSMLSTVARWTAPELVNGQSLATSASDVFSYGRTVLEILSGRKPFAEERGQYFRIVTKVGNGETPVRPMDEEALACGLTDQVWELCLLTWMFDPNGRPSMAFVVDQTEQLMITPY